MEIIKKYFPNTNTEKLQKFEIAEELYFSLNEKVNVISRKDIDFFKERHLLHSLAITKTKILQSSDNVIDIGTGGGFPGIPLAIFYPEINFTLIDSIGKKIAVVNEIVEKLQLKNVKTFVSRSENFKGKFDFITSRAVTNFPNFYKQTKHLLKKTERSGIIYLKGGDFDEEVAIFRNKIEIFNISNFFEENFFETKKIIYLKY